MHLCCFIMILVHIDGCDDSGECCVVLNTVLLNDSSKTVGLLRSKVSNSLQAI
jgi:hypothetical protein